MVNTFLAEEDQAIKQQFEKFAKDKIAQIVAKSTPNPTNSSALLKLIAQEGYLALNVPADSGGKDSSFLHLILLAETLAHCQAGLAVHLAYHAALIELLKAYGSEQQKNIYLPRLATGELLGTIAYLEESSKEATKVLAKGAKLILNGQKKLVILTESKNSGNAQMQMPNLLAVLADDKIVLLSNLSASSIKISAQNTKLQPKSIHLSNIIFENYELNQNDTLTSTKEKTDEALTFARDIIKTILAAAALGMVDNALSQTTNYVQGAQRNGSPLSQSQAVLWKLADASVDTSAARLLTYRAACSKDENKEAFPSHAAMAKSYAAEKANQYISQSLQILPPFSDTQYFDLTCFYIDSKILETFDATNEEEKVSLSKLLGI